ncbi:NAD-dependent epimerase/dehydratase family protein [Streptomyces sp. NPDC056049]|uniref:NAD-dependent epimerase/dehydratase family protein n=1 Tax=Streptomyces sp. NPDC056049 TaxID=3345693 RepID=UPI0035DDACCC
MAGPLSGSAPLVTVLGAGGFIGSAVARELVRRPIRLRLVARRPVTVPAGGAAEVEALTSDLTAPGAVAAAVAGADAVVHLAARFAGAEGHAGSSKWRVARGDEAAERINVGIMRELIDALAVGRPAAGPPPVVLFTGSTSQAGAPPSIRLDGTEPDEPVGEYARQKLIAERMLTAASAVGVVRGAGLRLTTVFGHVPGSPASDKGVVATMVRRALAGEPITLWHDGTVLRDLLHVDDAARAVAAALDHPDELAGRHWLVGTGRGEPLGKVFDEVARLVAAWKGRPPVPVLRVPPPDRAEATDFRGVEVDSTAFRAVTGWAPRVPLHEGLLRTAVALDQPFSTPA